MMKVLYVQVVKVALTLQEAAKCVKTNAAGGGLVGQFAPEAQAWAEVGPLALLEMSDYDFNVAGVFR